MSYILRWKNPALNANKAADIVVPVGSVVSNKASLRFTGKGAPGYGSIQQENLMRLLESFADGTAPQYPTVGQEWFDTTENIMKVCTSTSPTVWKSLGGIQVTASGTGAPSPAALGDVWFERTGGKSGIMYVYTGLGRHPSTETTIGGWSQVWPPVETIAGREEYDAVAALVTQFVREPLGKSIPALTNFAALDADLVAKFNSAPDAAVLVPVGGDKSELKVDPTSQDWDILLATARYGINRLDLPPSMLDDISPVPFVSDGRPVSPLLSGLQPTDVRYPSLERRSNRRFGIVTLTRAFAETINVLTAAQNVQRTVKGLNGATGANPTFASNTEIIDHAGFTGSPGGASSEQITLTFNFTNAAAMTSWYESGGAIQITASHRLNATPTAADTNLKNLLDSRGVLRINAVKTRVFANVYPLTISAPVTTPGIAGAPAGGQLVTTQTLGGATMNVYTASYEKSFNITIILNGGGSLNGTSLFAYQVIADNATYNAPAITRLYGKPLPFATGDKSGSAFLT